MKRWLIRIAVVLAAVEIVYLAVINVALNLPATQDYLNRIDPDRHLFRWDRAWSWYPFRVHAAGFSGNFQTWSQQWQVAVPEVSASVAVAPLLWRTVRFYDMNGDNIDLRVRPRPSPDRDDGDVRQYYPTIEGRDPNLPAGPLPTESPGWRFTFDIARVGGENDVWIWGTRATLAGTARGRIVHQSRHGPLTVEDGQADIMVKALTVDGSQVSNSGSIKGKFGVATFIPYQNRGLKSLAFVSIDADIDLPVDGLDFLNTYFATSTGMTVGGTGALRGRVAFDRGNLVAGTNLTISADGLAVAQPPYLIDGSGDVDIAVTSATPHVVGAAFRFASLSAVDQSDDATLFTGDNLQVTVERSAWVLPGGNAIGPSRVSLEVPMMTIADLGAYQRFLPTKWQVGVLGGTGSIDGRAEMSATGLDADLTLRSEGAKIRFKDDSFETDLELGLKARGQASDTAAQVDISGSYLSLDDSRLKRGNGNASAAWQARLSVSMGEADIDLPDPTTDAGTAGFWRLSRDRDLRALLSTLDGQIRADLAISDLNWANVLMDNPYSLTFNGSADIGADLTIRSGYLAEGSTLAMQPQIFVLHLLDYVAEGNGGFDLTVEKGGEAPDLHIEAKLTEASFRRLDEEQAVIDDMTIAVNASAKGVSLKDGGTVAAIDLAIPSAKVTDMTAYNAYLPKGSPLRILSGQADLSADVNMQESTTGGFVKLKTSRIEADLDGERMSGTVAFDIKINGGSAKDKSFDISGSSMTLDGVHVASESAAAAQHGWNARVDFGTSRVIWSRQATLDANASIRMTDTRPLVEIFEAHRKTHAWLDRILNLKDVRGNATIKIDPNELVIPYALAKSDTIEIGAKGLIREHDRQGIFYAKYGALAGIMEFDNGKKHFSLISPTKKFEEYVPGAKLPGMHEAGSSRGAVGGSRQNRPFSIFRRN
jgi:hypothetical protein